nr:hypothetical transcript [Hymenolepis microstoma]
MRQGQKEMNPSTITNTTNTSTAGGINSVLGTNGALGINLQSPWNSESNSRMVLPPVAFEQGEFGFIRPISGILTRDGSVEQMPPNREERKCEKETCFASPLMPFDFCG